MALPIGVENDLRYSYRPVESDEEVFSTSEFWSVHGLIRRVPNKVTRASRTRVSTYMDTPFPFYRVRLPKLESPRLLEVPIENDVRYSECLSCQGEYKTTFSAHAFVNVPHRVTKDDPHLAVHRNAIVHSAPSHSPFFCSRQRSARL